MADNKGLSTRSFQAMNFLFRSVSFIFATGATSFFLFAICYLLTDVLDWWNGAPFFYPGKNSRLVLVPVYSNLNSERRTANVQPLTAVSLLR